MAAWIVGINSALWFLNFFEVSQPANILTGEVGVQTAWRWLSYPLFTPTSIVGLLFLVFIFGWIGGSLERSWGTEKFARVFVVVVLLSAAFQWLGNVYLAEAWNPPFSLAGLYLPEATLFVIWAALNPEFTILAFFIIPVKAKYMAAFSIFVTYFGTGPILGLFAIAVPVGGWFWAKRQGASRGVTTPKKSFAQRIEDKKREKRKSSFTLLGGKGDKTSEPTAKASPPGPDLRELNRQKAAAEKTATQAELDRILDKIRFEGMSSLSDEEKATLDRQSRKLQDQG